MKQHGRKSAAKAIVEAMMAPSVIEGGFAKKPQPFEDMTEPQKKIWRAVVAGESAKFFATEATRRLLQEYCRHAAAADEMQKLLDEFDLTHLAEAKGMRRYEWLSRMQRAEAKAAMEFASKLRLTNLNRWQPKQAKAEEERDGGEEEGPWDSRASQEA